METLNTFLEMVVLEFLLLQLAFHFIQKIDKNHGFNVGDREKAYSLLVFIASSIIIMIKYRDKTDYYALSILMSYLVIVSIIDSQTKLVYRFINYIMMIIGSIYIITMNESALYFIYLIMFGLFVFFLVKIRGFGAGDGYFFFITGMFLINKSKIIPLMLPMLNIIISSLIFIFIYRNKFDWKTRKMKEMIAFTPSISISTFILLLI